MLFYSPAFFSVIECNGVFPTRRCLKVRSLEVRTITEHWVGGGTVGGGEGRGGDLLCLQNGPHNSAVNEKSL